MIYAQFIHTTNQIFSSSLHSHTQQSRVAATKAQTVYSTQVVTGHVQELLTIEKHQSCFYIYASHTGPCMFL